MKTLTIKITTNDLLVALTVLGFGLLAFHRIGVL